MQAVIARSFAFIYARNQPSLGLLGIVMTNDTFYEAAKEGEDIEIDVTNRRITVAGKAFDFKLSEIEYMLTRNKGISESYKMYGKALWQELTATSGSGKETASGIEQNVMKSPDKRMDW